VKHALQLYEALIEETESGKQFLTRDQKGVVSPFRLFLYLGCPRLLGAYLVQVGAIAITIARSLFLSCFGG